MNNHKNEAPLWRVFTLSVRRFSHSLPSRFHRQALIGLVALLGVIMLTAFSSSSSNGMFGSHLESESKSVVHTLDTETNQSTFTQLPDPSNREEEKPHPFHPFHVSLDRLPTTKSTGGMFNLQAENDSIATSSHDNRDAVHMIDAIAEIAGESQQGRVFSNLAQKQIQNYRSGDGLILNIHITHHGGTTFCGCIGHAKNPIREAPSFACMKDRGSNDVEFPSRNPWKANETDRNVEVVRRKFHMISWEFGKVPKVPLNSTKFENERLVSVLVMRDPLSRALAGDGITSRRYPDIVHGNATKETWWDFAKNYTKADNFALARLAGRAGKNFHDPTYLSVAKRIVNRMTFVLDLECLSDGIAKLAGLLGLELGQRCNLRSPQPHGRSLRKVHASIEKRMPFPDVLDYMRKKNSLDIDLYNWSKNLSLVKCADLRR